MSVTDKPHNKLIFSIGGGVKLAYRFIWGEKENGFATRCVTLRKKAVGALTLHTGRNRYICEKRRTQICPLPHPAKSLSPSFYVTQCKDEDFTEYKQKTS